MIYNEKQKTWTKWQSEVDISQRRYADTNDQQWWWGASINVIMQWNHNIIIYQCWKWSNWAKLITQNMMWSALNQRWLIGGKRSHKYNEVNFFSSTQNRWKGGTFDEKRETKLLSMWCNIARLCWKSIRGNFLIDYLSIGQWSTIDNKEWWGSYSTTFMFNTPRATTRKGGLILYSPIGQTILGLVSDNTR